MRRVVITGIGVISPLGNSYAEFKESLFAGRIGAGPITLFDPSPFPFKAAAEVKGFDPKDFFDEKHFEEALGRHDRKTEMGIGGGMAALMDARIHPPSPVPDRTGVSLGTGLSSVVLEELDQDLCPLLSEDGRLDLSRLTGLMDPPWPFSPWRHLPDLATMLLARHLKSRGPVFTSFSACAAAAEAIGRAFHAIRRGDADLFLAGGQDSMIHPLGVLSFFLLGALSTGDRPPEKISRPFDKKRDGFLLGEGAALFVLEEMERALVRGARIYAEMIGFGSSVDAFNVTAPHPEGKGAALSMRRALMDAGIAPEEVDYINAHGTSTPLNDVTETKAIKEVFGKHAFRLAVSSSKSQFGHLIAAAGAMELAALVGALEEGLLPPTMNLENPDPECDLFYVPNRAMKKEINIAISNSFGFGGQNVTLVARKFTEGKFP